MTDKVIGPKVSDINWDLYDGLEIAACSEGEDYTERLEPGDDTPPDFWTVYGHCETGGCEALWDFPSLESAHVWANEMTRKHANLHTHGIWVYAYSAD